MIPSTLHQALSLSTTDRRPLTIYNVPEIIKSLQQFATQEKSEIFAQIYPELLKLLLGCHCSFLSQGRCPSCVQDCIVDIFGTKKYTGAQIEQFHFLNVLSPLPNLFGYFSQIQINKLGKIQAEYSKRTGGIRYYSSARDSEECTHFLLNRELIQAKQIKSIEEIFPQPHNIFSLVIKFDQRRNEFDNYRFKTDYLPQVTRLLFASKLFSELPSLYTSLLRHKPNNPNYLNLSALEYYYFELFCSLRHNKPSYSTDRFKLYPTHYEWSEQLIQMDYLKRVNVFVHPLTKLLLQNFLLAIDMKLRKENERVLDLMLALFEEYLLQSPADQEILQNQQTHFKRTKLGIQFLTTPGIQQRKDKFHKPTLLHIECIYGCLELLSSFPEIYQQIIPAVQNYLMVLFVKWNQLWPDYQKSPSVSDLLPLFMKVIRPWHQNQYFSISSLEMKTRNFKFGILNYHFKKNLGDKSLLSTGIDKLRRKAKTMGASVMRRIIPNSTLFTHPERFESDGASFVYESLKGYITEMNEERGGIQWLHYAKRVSFPFSIKVFPIILKSGCFHHRNLSLRKIEFLSLFIKMIKPSQEGRIFDGFFLLDDSLDHFENPKDLNKTVLSMHNTTREMSRSSIHQFYQKYTIAKDEMRHSQFIKQGAKRCLEPFRVELDERERDEIISIITKLQNIKVSKYLTECLQEVNAKPNKKNVRNIRENAQSLKLLLMQYFRVSEINTLQDPAPKQSKSLAPASEKMRSLKRSPSFGNQDEFNMQIQEKKKPPIVHQYPPERVHRSVWCEDAYRNESEYVLRMARKCSYICDRLRGIKDEEYPMTNLRFLADKNLWLLGGFLFLLGAWFMI